MRTKQTTLEEDVHKIAFRLRANSIGTKDLTFDHMEEINQHLSYYEKKFLELFQAELAKEKTKWQVECDSNHNKD